ncbi:DUF1206 domain-containing protein [Sphingomicrobium nitratireducens]|uniref:DUF1206 domain-containing protein n=1 Tax=Sphingomicrobium nitratireducens TaxID=2964666 RepID=UPI00224085C0|nr:DUF1206 domain-containing protein [Sphingomicrobium nitratireducens]
MSKATQLGTWARLGYVARGLIFILVGYVALTSPRAKSGSDLFETVETMTSGTLLLAIIAVGAFGYGLFKLYDAAKNLENHDDDATGKAKRAFIAVGGLSYWILAYLALKQLFGSDGGGTSKEEAAEAVSQAGGDFLIIGLGLGLLVAGAFQIKKAATKEYMSKLVGSTPPGVEWAGLGGYVARGITLLVTGWYVFQGGLGSGEEVKGLGETLDTMRDTGLLYTALCVGLILFGLFSLVEAKYRTVPDEDVRPGH